MRTCFAIVPDGGDAPVAVFHDLEDAIEWALKKYGGDRFKIKHLSLLDTPAGAVPCN